MWFAKQKALIAFYLPFDTFINIFGLLDKEITCEEEKFDAKNLYQRISKTRILI